MKEQDPKLRIKNFNEVPLGYKEDEAIKEAARCLECKNPLCVKGCPACIDIPGFIREIKHKNYSASLNIIKKTNSLPAVCGRVCPQEDQCEKACILNSKNNPINIGNLERFVADWDRERGVFKELDIKENNIKVAVIGSGPASLACAYDLRIKGYEVTIFEALHKPGGVLVYGIPEFRLPKEIVQYEIDNMRKIGINIELNCLVGRTRSIDDLKDASFKAIFIGTGAGLPKFMGIEGENLNGVYTSNEFLTRVNLMKAYKFPEFDTPVNVGNNVAVIGGGNVAVDSARTALRLGARNVKLIYRRTKKEMPARKIEIEHAIEEGVEIIELKTPLKIEGDEKGNVKKFICQDNELGEEDASGRRRPVSIEGSFSSWDIDNIIVSIGSAANSLLLETIDNLDLDKKGYIIAKENGSTNISCIFAGGDIVTGSATVIAAIGAGKQSAITIDKYLKESKI